MNKTLLYFLSFTWGLPITLCGLFVAAFLLATGHRPYRRSGCWYFEVGKSNWGGLNLGLVIICQPNAPDYLKNHELGHSIQNGFFGFVMPIFVLCSVIRYHYISWREKHALPVPGYYDWWFEGQATRLGENHHSKYN